MKFILDSSFFFGDYSLDGELFTTPEVTEELKDLTSKMRFEVLTANGLCVTEAEPDDLLRVTKAALDSGDARVLSDTDLSVVALALTLDGTVVSDDFAVQNVCRHLKVSFQSILQKRAKKRVWKKICSGCGAVIPDSEEDCPVCGCAPVKRGTERPKKK
ncbi:MAG TPA: nucleotide-binding protein [Methanocorpusculum sp.]|nr:nucleotide-binding protein [Methanocorpusculum sp.]